MLDATPTMQWIPSVARANDVIIARASPGDPDVAHVLISSVRATIDGTNVQIASQRPVEDFSDAARVSNGWLFLTYRDRVFFSPTFLGALTEVSRAAPPRSERRAEDSEAPAASGALGWIDEDHRAWGATERGLERIDVGPARSIAFASPQRAAVVTIDGRLFALDGDRWRPLDLQGVAVSSARARDGKLIVRSSDGTRELRADGTLAPVASPPIVARLSHAQQLALLRAVFARWPRAFDALRIGGALSTQTIVPVGRDIARFDGVTGALLAVHQDVIPSSRCLLDPWGDRAVISCADAPFEFAWSATSGLSPSPFGRTEGPVALSEDGLHAVINEPCANAVDRERRSATSALCVWGPWGRWRTPPRWSEHDELVALRGPLAVVRGRDDHLAVLDLDRGSVEPIASDLIGAEEPTHITASIGADASIAMLAASEERPAEVTVLAHGARRRILAPSRATVVSTIASVDEHRLIISEFTAESVRYLDSMANEWRAVAIPTAAAHEPLARSASVPPEWACAIDGCRAENVWVGYTPGPSDDVVLFESLHRRPLIAPRGAQLGAQEAVCAITSRERPIEPGEELSDWGRVRILARVDPGGVHIDVSWSTHEAPSRRMRASATVSLGATRNALDRAPDTGWRVAIGTERFALIERCVYGGQRHVCDRFIATASGGLRPLEGLDRASHTALALERRDGAVALVADAMHYDDFATVALLDRDGALRLRSATLLPSARSRPAQLAIRGAQVGFVRVDGGLDDLRARFRPVFDGDRLASPSIEASLTPLVSDALPWCRGPADADAITLLVSSTSNAPQWLSTEHADSVSVWRMEASEQWCARRYTRERPLTYDGALSIEASASPAFASMSAVATGGVIAEGHAIRGHAQQSVRCLPSP